MKGRRDEGRKGRRKSGRDGGREEGMNYSELNKKLFPN